MNRMMRIRLWVVFICLFALLTMPSAKMQAAGARFVAGQVVVRLNPATPGVTIDAINATYRTRTIKPIVGLPGAYLLSIAAGDTVEGVVARMAGDTRLLYAEPVFYNEAPEAGGRGIWAWGGSDPTPMTKQYALTLLNLPEAHKISQGAGVIIAVLDTGFQLDHPNLKGSWTTARFDFIDNDANPNNILDADKNGQADGVSGHGTHVAAIIHQTAPAAQIMPLRVLNLDGVGDSVRIAEAIRFAVNNGARVINLSLGSPDESKLIQEAAYLANRNNNVLSIAAAGNSGLDKKSFPAATNNSFIAVASVGPTRQKSSFSNFGSWVDIVAPGETIYSAMPTNGYASWSGTSMATPFIAGEIGLLVSKCPGTKANKIEKALYESARVVGDKLGFGLPNVAASLTNLKKDCVTTVRSTDAEEQAEQAEEQAEVDPADAWLEQVVDAEGQDVPSDPPNIPEEPFIASQALYLPFAQLDAEQ